MSAGRGGHPLAYPGLALSVTAVSFSGIFIREANDGAATVVWVRMALTLVLIAPLVVRDARRRMLPRTAAEWRVVGFSGACLAAHFLTWTASLRYTSVASSVLLVSMHPVLVAALSRRLLDEAVPLRLWVGIGLALLGTLVTAAGDLRVSSSALGGDLLAIAGAVTVTGYLIAGRHVRGRYGPAGYSAPCYAITALAALAVCPLGGGAVIPSGRTLLAGLGLAAVCTVLGHTVLNWTLNHLPAATVSLSLIGEPPLTALLAIPLLAELPPLTTVVGGAVILAGLAVAVLERPGRAEVAELAAVEI